MVWTGQFRMSPSARAEFRKAATVIFGLDAFNYLVTVQKVWLAGVSVAKKTILSGRSSARTCSRPRTSAS